MPLRIGFDIDGVLADMEAELVRQARILFDRADEDPADQQLPAVDPERQAAAESAPENVPPLAKLQLTTRQQRKLWRHVESIENFWETLQEIEPRAIQRLATLANERRWEIIFLTRRPESAGSTAQLQTQRWLESRGFRLPSVYVVQGSRGRIAAALGLDIVVDDRPDNCLDVIVDSKARAILVWRDDERLLPAAAKRLGIGVVKNVGECLDILTQVDAVDRDQPGVLERVRKLLGLKETSANA